MVSSRMQSTHPLGSKSHSLHSECVCAEDPGEGLRQSVSHLPRDSTIVNHSRNGSYGESSLEAHIWPEEEEVVQANRRCQDMEYT